MDSADLTSLMQEMMADMAAMQAELADLKQRANEIILPQPNPPVVSTTRRKALRRLAGGLLAGLTVGSVGASMPQVAQAKFVAAGTAGAIVVPPGGTVSGNLTGSNSYGLVATPDTSLSTSSLSFVSKAGVAGITTASAPFTYGVYGSGGAVGVFGTASAGVIGSAGVTGTGNYGVTGIGNINGVRGVSTDGSGVYGSSDTGIGVESISTNGRAVNGTSTNGVGVYGTSTNYLGVRGDSTNNYGVRGNSNTYTGVYGYSASTAQNTAGVQGNAEGNADYTYGVYGTTNNVHRLTAGVRGDGGNIGVWGFGTGGGVGIYGSSDTGTYAGIFDKNILVSGYVYAGAKPFKIDHPLDPANKYLHHIAIESPDMTNLYNGLVRLDEQGEATVEMPNWFEALNSDFRYQLTCLGKYAPIYISEEIKEQKFKIAGGLPGQKVSWMVTGIRQDAWAKANRIPVEEDKTESEKGRFLHPEVFGKAAELKIM